jgi:hypothetical protein
MTIENEGYDMYLSPRHNFKMANVFETCDFDKSRKTAPFRPEPTISKWKIDTQVDLYGIEPGGSTVVLFQQVPRSMIGRVAAAYE